MAMMLVGFEPVGFGTAKGSGAKVPFQKNDRINGSLALTSLSRAVEPSGFGTAKGSGAKVSFQKKDRMNGSLVLTSRLDLYFPSPCPVLYFVVSSGPTSTYRYKAVTS